MLILNFDFWIIVSGEQDLIGLGCGQSHFDWIQSLMISLLIGQETHFQNPDILIGC